VLFDAEQSESELVLRNALKVEQVEDPVEAGESSVLLWVEHGAPPSRFPDYRTGIRWFSVTERPLVCVAAVQGVVNKCQKVGLMQIYEIADFNTVEEFLFRVAQKRGKLGKVSSLCCDFGNITCGVCGCVL